MATHFELLDMTISFSWNTVCSRTARLVEPWTAWKVKEKWTWTALLFNLYQCAIEGNPVSINYTLTLDSPMRTVSFLSVVRRCCWTRGAWTASWTCPARPGSRLTGSRGHGTAAHPALSSHSRLNTKQNK